MPIRTLLFALFALAMVASRAEAKHSRFVGPHPIAARFGGGYCYIEAPHLHLYAPDRPALYQEVGEDYVFTGDPTPFGYAGERHPFYGHHPVVIGPDGATDRDATSSARAPEPIYCLIEGPHFHAYAAPSTPDYRVTNGVAFYVTPIPAPYVRPAHVRAVNAEYRPYVSFRPTVEVAPPPEWHGEVYVARPSVELGGPSVEVRAPSVEVRAPSVEVRAPSVEVRTPGVWAPRPPHVAVEVHAPGVFVAPPAPHVILGGPRFVVGAPPRVIVGAPGPIEVGVRRQGHWEHGDEARGERHDHGRHEGGGRGEHEHEHGRGRH